MIFTVIVTQWAVEVSNGESTILYPKEVANLPLNRVIDQFNADLSKGNALVSDSKVVNYWK